MGRLTLAVDSSGTAILHIAVAPVMRRASQVFYFDGHRIFVHTRVKNGKCFVPGGHQEAHDRDARHTAWREGREETGVTVPIESLHRSWEGAGTDGASWTLSDFVVRIHPSTSHLLSCVEAEKHRDGRWLSVTDLGLMPLSKLHDENFVMRAHAAATTARSLKLQPVSPLPNRLVERAACLIQQRVRGPPNQADPPVASWAAHRETVLRRARFRTILNVFASWRAQMLASRQIRQALPPAAADEVRRAAAAYESEQLEEQQRVQRQREKLLAKQRRAAKLTGSGSANETASAASPPQGSQEL